MSFIPTSGTIGLIGKLPPTTLSTGVIKIEHSYQNIHHYQES